MTFRYTDCADARLIKFRVETYLASIQFRPTEPQATSKRFPWFYYWSEGEPRR